MAFAREFFDLQFSCAERVRELSGMPLDRALFEYTNLYVRFGFGRDFDPSCEGWQAYLAGLRRAADGREWTYRFYMENPEANTAPALDATFGCFSYVLKSDGRVRLHFRNADAHGSPLGIARVDQRRADLRALFEHLKTKVSDDASIVGVSWLYNIDAYRRLFPAVYTASARAVRGTFRSMPLWGQFLDHTGELEQTMARRFLASLAELPSADRLDECFPFEVLTVQAPARQFYDCYGIG